MGVTERRKERIREDMKREMNNSREHSDISSLSFVHEIL